MEPTIKSVEVDDFLTKIAGISRQEAANKRICVMCGGDAKHFKDLISVQEYRISCMCQKCQDSVFS